MEIDLIKNAKSSNANVELYIEGILLRAGWSTQRSLKRIKIYW